MTSPDRHSGASEHGDVFGRGSGNMFIHVQRESGLAHRTLVLRPWQVQALRLVVSRWFALVVTAAGLSWFYFAVQTARLPFLTQRVTHLESDAAKLDTLQATLNQLQRRYDQVQQMLSAASKPAVAAAPSRSEPAASPTSEAKREPRNDAKNDAKSEAKSSAKSDTTRESKSDAKSVAPTKSTTKAPPPVPPFPN